jgi:hypothetical protein
MVRAEIKGTIKQPQNAPINKCVNTVKGTYSTGAVEAAR